MEEKVCSKRKGSFLEWIIKKLFDNAGFETILNPKYETKLLDKKEIDIEATHLGKKILISCKQYEKATSPVSDLILQSSSLKNLLKADVFVQVLWGYPEIKEKDDNLAKAHGVIIWNDLRIMNLFDLVFKKGEEAKSEILSQLGIDVEEAKIYEKKILNKYNENTKIIMELIEKIMKQDKREEMWFADFSDKYAPWLFRTNRYIELKFNMVLGRWIEEIWQNKTPLLYKKLKNFFLENKIYIEFYPEYEELFLLIKVDNNGHRINEKNPERWWESKKRELIKRQKNPKYLF